MAATLMEVAELVVPGELFGDSESEDPLSLVLALFAIGLGLLEIGVFIATVVFFLMWLYRSHENLTAFGVRKNSLQYSSGWAVGSFFIPFVNLVVPYRAIKELWRKSVPNTDSMFSELSPPGSFRSGGHSGFFLISPIESISECPGGTTYRPMSQRRWGS